MRSSTSPTISAVMTPSPHTIGVSVPLAVAQRYMREHDVRHLPVLERGLVVGVLSQRDLALAASIGGNVMDDATVGECMSPDPYVVGPRASLAQVARHMADKKLGSAIIAEKGWVKGIFTTTDALEVLAGLLAARKPSLRGGARGRASRAPRSTPPARPTPRPARQPEPSR